MVVENWREHRDRRRMDCIRDRLRARSAMELARQICRLTLQARTSAQAAASSTPSRLSDSSRRPDARGTAFSLRKTEPQTSATALWTSGLASGRFLCSCFQVEITRTSSVEGTRRYLNNEEQVSRKMVKVAALSERGRRAKRRDTKSSYRGASTERRSCVSFCSRLVIRS
jgi:hypothetical protein